MTSDQNRTSDSPDRNKALSGQVSPVETGTVAAGSAFDLRTTSMLAMAGTLSFATLEFHRTMLAEARTSLAAGHCEMAVVLAEVAAEQCTEWALNGLLTARKNEDLAKPLMELFSRRACDIVGNKSLRKLYNVLAKDDVGSASFWQSLSNHNARRNGVVHEGDKCLPGEATKSIDAVAAFITHMEARLRAAQILAEPSVLNLSNA
jgi:hypothetical protein